MSSAAPEAIDLAERLGVELDPWQKLCLHHALGETDEGLWSAFEIGLTVPRQNGKSAIIEILIVSGLLLFDEDLIVYSAHEFRTVKEIMRRVEGLLRASGEQYRPRRSHGEEGFALGTDPHDPEAPRVIFQSRTGIAGRGLTGDRVILDEAMIIHPEDIAALMPTMASRPNPQIIYAGSAVNQEMHPHGHVFAGVRDRALSRMSPRLCYLEWSCEDGADPTSLRARAQSNPSMGLRISADYIDGEYQALLHTPKIFLVERLGVGDWPTLADKRRPAIARDVWLDELTDRQPDLAGPGPAVIAIDRGPVSKTWVIVGAQRRTDGGVHLEVGYCQGASATDVVEALMAVVADADPAALVIDSKSPAIVLKPHLLKAGVEPMVTSATDYMAAWSALGEAMDSRQLSHSGQPILTQSILGAVHKDRPDGRSVPEGLPGTWLGPMLAMMLAHWALLDVPPPRPAPPPPMTSETPKGVATSSSSDLDVMAVPF